jgi:hypothetical protein
MSARLKASPVMATVAHIPSDRFWGHLTIFRAQGLSSGQLARAQNVGKNQKSCFFFSLCARPLPPWLDDKGWPSSSYFVCAKNDLVWLNWMNS